MNRDTIGAISTGMTNSGIGIVRIIGDKAFAIADEIYKGSKQISQQDSHTIHYGHIVDNDQILDEVLVSVMKAPKTYTGEDTIEINCHGGAFVVNKVLELVIGKGARLAEPGEITKRAFLNGKMDLSQSEAVVDLIQAKNDFALKNSINHLKGSVKNSITKIREEIIYQMAFIEATLDDPENYDSEGFNDTLRAVVTEVIDEITRLTRLADEGRVLTEGIQTVIIGKPNVGKSSLLNVLAGREKAIVTEIEGTTRDALEESITLGGLSLNIVDTAGIRETEDIIERIGVDKAKEHLERADLIVFVVDASKEIDGNDERIIGLVGGKKAIVLLNKTDLKSVVSKEKLQEKLHEVMRVERSYEEAKMKAALQEEGEVGRKSNKKAEKETKKATKNKKEEPVQENEKEDCEKNARKSAKNTQGEVFSRAHSQEKFTLLLPPIIEVSAKEEQGIEDFVATIKEMFLRKEMTFNDEVFVSNLRQKNALCEALESLQKVMKSIDEDLPEDFFAIDLMDAYQALGKITGETIGEDLINEIFGKFCMGK